MKTNGGLQYDYELLPELEPIDGCQTFDLEFIERDMKFMVFAKILVDVCAVKDGDGWNTPYTNEITWARVFDLSLDICDENGDEVEDENDLIYNEVLTFLKDFYER